MRATRPLFRLDPGWMFIAAGLVVCAAGVLLPAQADLRGLEEQLAQLRGEEARAYQRLAAHAEFIDQVDRSDPAIIKRLAAAQLNLVPEGDKPVLLAGTNVAPVTNWIDNTLDTDIRPPQLEPLSTLSRWANGPSRLWMFGGGIMAVFIGLLIAPESHRRAQRSMRTECESSAREWLAPGEVEVVRRFPPAMRSLPETADIEVPADLSQQEDTVDLEECELPARSRTIIDDDAAWHGAAAVEHAGEIIVQADEVVPAHEASLLRADLNEIAADEQDHAEPDCDSVTSENANVVDDVVHSAGDDVEPWSIDDDQRLSQSSKSLPPAECGENESEEAIAGISAVETRSDAPVLDAEARVEESRTKSTPPAKRQESTRKAKSAKRQYVERKPARRRAHDNDDAGAIPFLRFRPDMNDSDDDANDDKSADDRESNDDLLPAMAEGEPDEGDVAGDAEGDGCDGDDSMTFRDR